VVASVRAVNLWHPCVMRVWEIVSVVAALGCEGRASAQVPPRVPRNDASVSPSARSFAGVQGWGPVRWNMNVAEARAALLGIGIAATEPPSSGATGIFVPAGPVGAPTRAPGFVEQTFHRLEFTHRGLRGSLEFAGLRLRTVTLFRDGLTTRAAVDAVVADLVRDYGAPVTHQPRAWDQNGVMLARWVNPNTQLEVSTYGAPAGPRTAIMTFRRLPQTWP